MTLRQSSVAMQKASRSVLRAWSLSQFSVYLDCNSKRTNYKYHEGPILRQTTKIQVAFDFIYMGSITELVREAFVEDI